MGLDVSYVDTLNSSDILMTNYRTFVSKKRQKTDLKLKK